MAATSAQAVVTMWHFDSAAQTFEGFAPSSRGASNFMTLNRLDAVFLCMSAPGTLTRPVI